MSNPAEPASGSDPKSDAQSDAQSASTATPSNSKDSPTKEASQIDAARLNRRNLAKPLVTGLVLVLVAVASFMMGRASVGVPDPVATQANQANQPPAQEPEKAASQTNPDALALLRAEPSRIADDPRAMGRVDAPVVMVSFEDFSCPMCTQFQINGFPQLKPLIDEGVLRVEWRDTVIFKNYGSHIAAAGSRAAANQGKFWEFVDTAFDTAGLGNHPEYTEESVIQLAVSAGVPDIEKFKADLVDPEIANAVAEETNHALQGLGLTGTPAMMINDAFVAGARPAEFFINTIQDQAAQLGN